MLPSGIAENILHSFLSIGVEGCREARANRANKRPSLDSHLLALLFLSLLSHVLGLIPIIIVLSPLIRIWLFYSIHIFPLPAMEIERKSANSRVNLIVCF